MVAWAADSDRLLGVTRADVAEMGDVYRRSYSRPCKRGQFRPEYL